MNIPEQALDIIRLFEGLRLEKYTDLTGNSTIGYGHKVLPSENIPDTITLPEAEELLLSDANVAMRSVKKLTTVYLPDFKLSALIDFVYNLGAGTFERSTLRQVVNRREFVYAPPEFMKYVHAGPIIPIGLIKRRKAEVALWNGESIPSALTNSQQ